MMQYVLNGYLKSLLFESKVKQSVKKITVPNKEHELLIYHFDVIDSTMNICAKMP